MPVPYRAMPHALHALRASCIIRQQESLIEMLMQRYCRVTSKSNRKHPEPVDTEADVTLPHPPAAFSTVINALEIQRSNTTRRRKYFSQDPFNPFVARTLPKSFNRAISQHLLLSTNRVYFCASFSPPLLKVLDRAVA